MCCKSDASTPKQYFKCTTSMSAVCMFTFMVFIHLFSTVQNLKKNASASMILLRPGFLYFVINMIQRTYMRENCGGYHAWRCQYDVKNLAAIRHDVHQESWDNLGPIRLIISHLTPTNLTLGLDLHPWDPGKIWFLFPWKVSIPASKIPW